MVREMLIQDYYAADNESARAERMNSPSMMLLPKLSIDGDQWCALFGEDLQNGVAGFDDSPHEAYLAFDKAWYAKLPRSNHE